MNLKNVIENLVITIIAMVAGGILAYHVTITTAETMIEAQSETIRAAIAKETTAIHNTLNNTFKKIKKSDSLKIVIDPTVNSAIQTNKEIVKDSILTDQPKKKKGFFKRLFSKKQKK